MARRSSIPDFGIEYPEYEYRAWPKQVGLDASGEPLIANNQEEYDALKSEAAFPKLMGKDKYGNDVVAHFPRDLEWRKAEVAKQAEASDEVENALQPRRGPGRPPKYEAA